jgi:hypothetical protein
MKAFKVTVISILIAITLIGCTKDEIFSASMKARIDNQEWIAAVRVTVMESGKLIITGTSAGGSVIIITVNGTDEGTYSLSAIPLSTGFGALYKTTPSMSDDDAYISTSGQVVLTEVDTSGKRVSGTFSFNVSRSSETISITNGTFTDLMYSGN